MAIKTPQIPNIPGLPPQAQTALQQALEVIVQELNRKADA
jgi:hypothetical protein